jgi:hypothetical protein
LKNFCNLFPSPQPSPKRRGGNRKTKSFSPLGREMKRGKKKIDLSPKGEGVEN